MLFGNWLVDDKSILWNADKFNRFEIDAGKLVAVTTLPDNTRVYEWIMLATEEDWLTQNDLYDLNFAFVYAAAKFNVGFEYELFDATLEKQYELFEQEDDEDGL